MTGNDLRAFRVRLGLNRSKFADRIGYGERQVAAWETDEKIIPLRAELACAAVAVGMKSFDDVAGVVLALSVAGGV